MFRLQTVEREDIAGFHLSAFAHGDERLLALGQHDPGRNITTGFTKAINFAVARVPAFHFGLGLVGSNVSMLGDHLARQKVNLVGKVIVFLEIDPEHAPHPAAGKVAETEIGDPKIGRPFLGILDVHVIAVALHHVEVGFLGDFLLEFAVLVKVGVGVFGECGFLGVHGRILGEGDGSAEGGCAGGGGHQLNVFASGHVHCAWLV